MIERIRGRLEEVGEESALVDLGGVVLEASLPPVDRYRLLPRVGETVELYTVAFLQGGVGGASLTPVLVGFLEPEERDFWLRLSGAGGLGQRTALRAMSVEVAAIARAIEEGDEAWLTRLPGIGRQRASELVARLRGRVADFALRAVARPAAGRPSPGRGGGGGGAAARAGEGEAGPGGHPASAGEAAAGSAPQAAGAAEAGEGALWAEALQVLEQLGHPPAEAVAMLRRALAAGGRFRSAGELVREAYRQAGQRAGE